MGRCFQDFQNFHILEKRTGLAILPATMDIKALAREFSALGSEDRLKILALLLRGELPSCGEIARGLNLSGPALSYHLRTLEGAGLIVRTRRGRTRCPKLTPRLGEILREDLLRRLKEEVGTDGT